MRECVGSDAFLQYYHTAYQAGVQKMLQFLATQGYGEGSIQLQTMMLFAHHSASFLNAWRPASEGGSYPGTVCHGDFRADNTFFTGGTAAELSRDPLLATPFDYQVRRRMHMYRERLFD